MGDDDQCAKNVTISKPNTDQRATGTLWTGKAVSLSTVVLVGQARQIHLPLQDGAL